MNADFCHEDETSQPYGSDGAASNSLADHDATAALPTLLLLLPCLVTGIWILVSN